MTSHRLVGMPIAPSGQTVSREQLIQHGMAMCQVPLDIGTFRKLKERSEGAKQNAFAIDVIFNPFVVKLFTDDDFCNANERLESFRPWLTNVAFNNIEKNLGVKLSRNEVKLVKSCRYKDGQGADGRIPRDFVDVVEDDEPPELERPPEVSPEPLIEEVAAQQGRKKPAVKKGFLNNNKGPTLYGPEGSKEGVVHEDAGNPLGYIPKGLRKKCNIVDCNSPEYQESERKKKAADEHNKHVSEFNNLLQKDLGGAQRRQQMQKYDDETPDGETAASQKYNVDYSRFTKIAEADGGDDEVEQRDWYYDSDGKIKEISKKATSSAGYPVAPGDAGAGPPKKSQLKKGFFSDAKGSLYGPEGSAQGSVPKPMEELLQSEAGKGDQSDFMKELSKMMGAEAGQGPQSDMMKEFGKMMGNDGKVDQSALMKEFSRVLGNQTDDPEKQAELQRNLEMLMKYQQQRTGGEDDKDVPKKTNSKAADLPVPGHTITTSEDGSSLILSVEVPSLASMEGVGLDVAEKSASLVFPLALNIGTLKTPLPKEVVPTKAKAKFSKKNHRITVTMPIA